MTNEPGPWQYLFVRRLWQEFKGFAMSGNMLDLALGFLIGTAFATLIASLANNVFMQFVAAIIGKPDFNDLVITVNHAKIQYGKFITDLINFLMLAAVLFLIVKLIVFAGVGRGRVFGDKQCPYCHEKVAPAALICKWCRQQLVDELPSLAEAQQRFDELQARRKLAVSLPPIPTRLPARLPGRRKDTEPGAAGPPGEDGN